MSNRVALFGNKSSNWPVAEVLAKVRGAMWTQRLQLPMGPYPNQPYNINAMDFYELYSPDDRKRMIEKTLNGNYTHAPTGPIFDSGGYHGRWPAQTDLSQNAWDHYLDAMEEWKDAGIIPIHFIKPDNWTFDAMRLQLEHLYLQPRAQALLPIVVPAGWEPFGYETSTRTWGLFFDWAAQVLPNSLIMAHSVCDMDCLKGNDKLYNDEPDSNGKSWQYLTPKLHGWLIQLCGYVNSDGSPAAIAEWERNLTAYFKDIIKRFHTGYPGDWPTGSRWGANVPMKCYYGEGASYKFFNDPTVTEALVESFGDIAVANGADGSLDALSASTKL